jgi:hypothetical protein
MHEFFRGWRRKTGCVILVVACFLMIGWIRSLVWRDSTIIRTDSDTAYHLFTTPHRLHCERMVWVGSSWGIMDDDLDVTLSFWYFAVSLTLLSAHLILWQPCKRQAATEGFPEWTGSTTSAG